MVDSKQQWKAWIYLAPAIALLLVFTVWPIFNTVRMALLENYSGLKAAAGMQFEFGFGNFIKVLEYKRFLNCLKNTVLLCVLTVPVLADAGKSDDIVILYTNDVHTYIDGVLSYDVIAGIKTELKVYPCTAG